MKILLATLHAKYVHASLALPCLAAACAGMEGVTAVIREFTVNEPADRVLRALIAEEADAVAFSCYIWNIEATLRLAADLKKVLPRIFMILGGPEVSYDAEALLADNPEIDAIVRGEGEETFRELAGALARTGAARDALHCVSTGIAFRNGERIVATPERPPIADLDTIPSPFAAGLVDLAKPLVYYETSRGCPFSCAFCMSSLEKGVRSFSSARIEADLECLMARGVNTVKLVDRTFNYDAARANDIWRFILARNRGSRFHFEIAADLLTEENLRLLAQVPAGMFRFEIGVQSGEEETLARVGRRSDLKKLFASVERLVADTGVTVHLDLVAGLPGEDYDGFLRSLQQLFDVLSNDNSYFFGHPPHIQVEPLKVLKGSPMERIAGEEGYAYSDTPPYKILGTPWLTFGEICRIETIARLLDLVHNSGRFNATLETLAQTAPLSLIFSRFASFWEGEGTDGHLSQEGLFELVWRFAESQVPEERREAVREALCYDCCLAEYPAARLPDFFGGSGAQAKWDKGELDRLTAELGIEKGSRVRGFVRRFPRDFRSLPWREGELDLLFVYASAPGKGLRVEVLEKPHRSPLP